jgi:hypothetical protein
MNIERLRRIVQRARAQLAAESVVEIEPGSGMAGLKRAMALARARRAREQGLIDEAAVDRGHALPPVPANPAEALANLRRDMLAEQRWRAEWLAEKSIEERAKEPAINDDEPDDEFKGERGGAPANVEECEPCTAPLSPAPESQDS